MAERRSRSHATNDPPKTLRPAESAPAAAELRYADARQAARPRTAWRLWWERQAQPPPTQHLIVAGAVTLLMIWANSNARHGGVIGNCLTVTGALIFGPALAIPHAVRALATWTAPPRDDGARSPAKKPAWRWLVVPACLLITGSTLVSAWPRHIRFAASRPALEAEARRLLAPAPETRRHGGDWFPVERLIGLYYVRAAKVTANPPTVYFCTEEDFVDRSGFAFDAQRTATWAQDLWSGWRTFTDSY